MSMLVNISASIMFTAMPTYMTTVLKVSPFALGHIEGGLELVAYFLRVFSGVISDIFRCRKFLLVIALVFIVFSRPLLAFFPFLGIVIFARVLDRLGNGLQASPREALISDYSNRETKGAAYGLRNSLGMVGSLGGSALLWWLMHKTSGDYQFIFTVAIVPPVTALLLLLFFVKDKKENPRNTQVRSHFSFHEINNLPKKYWFILGVAAFYCLANPAGSFLILHAQEKGLNACDAPTIMMMQNILAALISYPVGRLSDRVNRIHMLMLCSVLMIVANMFMARAEGVAMVYVGVAVWGLQFGLNQSLLFAEIANTVPKGLRGTGFGLFYLVAGVFLYASNATAGYLLQHYGSSSIFILGSFWAVGGLGLLIFMKHARMRTEKKQ